MSNSNRSSSGFNDSSNHHSVGQTEDSGQQSDSVGNNMFHQHHIYFPLLEPQPDDQLHLDDFLRFDTLNNTLPSHFDTAGQINNLVDTAQQSRLTYGLPNDDINALISSSTRNIHFPADSRLDNNLLDTVHQPGFTYGAPSSEINLTISAATMNTRSPTYASGVAGPSFFTNDIQNAAHGQSSMGTTSHQLPISSSKRLTQPKPASGTNPSMSMLPGPGTQVPTATNEDRRTSSSRGTSAQSKNYIYSFNRLSPGGTSEELFRYDPSSNTASSTPMPTIAQRIQDITDQTEDRPAAKRPATRENRY